MEAPVANPDEVVAGTDGAATAREREWRVPPMESEGSSIRPAASGWVRGGVQSAGFRHMRRWRRGRNVAANYGVAAEIAASRICKSERLADRNGNTADAPHTPSSSSRARTEDSERL